MLLRATFLSLLFIGSDGSPPQMAESSTCAAPWMDGSSVGLGCLHFSSENAMTWYDADAFCHDQHNSKLISIESSEQNEFVKMVLAFLGGHEETHNCHGLPEQTKEERGSGTGQQPSVMLAVSCGPLDSPME